MGRRGITLADVQRAKTALEARGQRPSADNIRAFLGSGSKTTVLELLAEIASTNGDTSSIKEPPEELPPELQQVMCSAAAVWYAAARAGLVAQADDARIRLKEEAAQLAEVRAESLAAQERAENLENDRAEIRDELVSAKAEVATLLTELRRTQQELASALGVASSERARADSALVEAKESRRSATDELNLRIALERDKAALAAQLAAATPGKAVDLGKRIRSRSSAKDT